MISVLAILAALGIPNDVATFFQKHQGQLRIVSVNGKPPHPENDQAYVVADAKQGLLVMPFCNEEVCDPGYLDFPYDKFLLTQNGEVFTLQSFADNGERVSVFTWTDGRGTQVFDNHQYMTSSGKVMRLTHEMQRTE